MVIDYGRVEGNICEKASHRVRTSQVVNVIRLNQLNVSFAKDMLLIVEVVNNRPGQYKENFIKIMIVDTGTIALIKT